MPIPSDLVRGVAVVGIAVFLFQYVRVPSLPIEGFKIVPVPSLAG